jgi:hypothetical protein
MFSDIFLKSTGVYKIQNVVNMKIYLGSAAGKSGFYSRKSKHFSLLKRNLHPNLHLQGAWNKYGEENFIFVPLKECSPEECMDWEQFFIDIYSPEYNICKIAGNKLGCKATKEQREGYGNNYFLISPTGQMVAGNNIALFADSLGINSNNLRAVSSGVDFSYKGWTNCFENYLKIKYYGKVHNTCTPPIKVFHKDYGIKIVWGRHKFAKANRLSSGHFSQVCNGIRKETGGWFLYNKENMEKYVKDQNIFPVCLINKKIQEEAVLNSRKDISVFRKKYGFQKTGDIWKLIRQERKITKDWELKI